MGLIELSHALQRRDVDGRLRAWFWKSAVGRWIFRVAGAGLKRRAATGSATYRPTEFAIGLEAERLFDELPRPIRRQLAGLPDVLRVLEDDAQQMRGRVDELNEVLARVRVDRPAARSLKVAPEPGTEAEVAERQEKLEQDILAARDATQQRLADAVAALETVRLGLLRMQAGSATVESLTGDLAAAREVAADADRLIEAQQDVERLLTAKDD
jgi:hypothetical protein